MSFLGRAKILITVPQGCPEPPASALEAEEGQVLYPLDFLPPRRGLVEEFEPNFDEHLASFDDYDDAPTTLTDTFLAMKRRFGNITRRSTAHLFGWGALAVSFSYLLSHPPKGETESSTMHILHLMMVIAKAAWFLKHGLFSLTLFLFSVLILSDTSSPRRRRLYRRCELKFKNRSAFDSACLCLSVPNSHLLCEHMERSVPCGRGDCLLIFIQEVSDVYSTRVVGALSNTAAD